MTTYKLLSGETLELPAIAPEMGDFLARVRVAAANPTVDVNDLIDLIYGLENPLLDHTILPGRAMVTKAIFENPLYRVLTDLIEQKRLQRGLVDPAAAEACYTMSVSEAAERLGITTGAVRMAISARKLPAIRRNGQWWLRESSVDSYKVGTRGPKPATPRPTPAVEPVIVRMGNEPGRSLSILVLGGEVVREGKSKEGTLSPGWQRATVRTTAGAVAHLYEIEPAAGEAGEIIHGGLYVRGPFRVTRRINNTKAANEAWKESREAVG